MSMQTSTRLISFVPAPVSGTKDPQGFLKSTKIVGRANSCTVPSSPEPRRQTTAIISILLRPDVRGGRQIEIALASCLHPYYFPIPEPEPAQVGHLDSAPIPQLSGDNHGNLRSQPPPTIPEVPTTGPTHQPTHQFPIPTRPRINSLVNPANPSASPLALLLQPLIVDEDVIMEDQEDNQNPQKAPNPLSYRPALEGD